MGAAGTSVSLEDAKRVVGGFIEEYNTKRRLA
jgi:hypothetical protein